MIHTLLIPVDGSPFAEQAVPLAEGIARRAGARLDVVLVHVPQAPVENISDFPASVDEDTTVREREYLRALRERLEKTAGVDVQTYHPRGYVVDALEEQVKRSRADLVVMATHGRGPLSRLWLGSVADAMIRHTSAPVLLVRPHDEGPQPVSNPRGLQHVLIPLDGSPLAETILEPAVAVGSLTQARYTLLRVVSPLSAWGGSGHDPLIRKAEAAALAYLDGVADRLKHRGLNVETRVGVGLKAAPVILSEAGTLGADLIALATRARGRLPRLLVGSVADKVVRGANTPVLVYRAPHD